VSKTKKANVLPQTRETLRIMGENIKMARLRRDLTVNLVCERAAISRATLWKVEKGDPSVAIGIYAAVLHALQGMEKDLLLIAKDDLIGKTIVDLKIKTRKRASGGK